MKGAGTPNIDLSPHDRREVERVLQACVPRCEVWAFGSRAKWTAKQYSDLDLAIISEEPLPIAIMAELRDSFDESDMTIKVDVVDWATTSESFRKIIQSNRVVIQAGPQCASKFPLPEGEG
jgi:predicted nucleotidyltransferase